MPTTDLDRNGMMKHLKSALERGEDIGHYGRLTFAIVARHFMEPMQIVDLLCLGKGCDEHHAKSLVHQVLSRGYNPPSRQRIAQWQQEQDFPICPHGDDPDACNLYRDLKFPDGVYEKIEHYHEEKLDSEQHQAAR